MKVPQGLVVTKKGIVKFDVKGRKRKNWISLYKNKSRRFLKEKCEICGRKDNLTIHHIKPISCNNGILKEVRTLDELNFRVLNPENLQTLCRRCHDFKHGFI